jgi:hypothetical protein
MTLFNFFKSRQTGSGLRISILNDALEIKFDMGNSKVFQLTLDQLRNKVNDFFSVHYFSNDTLVQLDQICLSDQDSITNANDLKEKYQSCLEFFCELLFVTGADDDINLSKEHQKMLRSIIIKQDMAEFIVELRRIASEFMDGISAPGAKAHGLVNADFSGKIGANPKWMTFSSVLEAKTALAQTKEVLMRFGLGSLDGQYVEFVKDFVRHDEVTTKNYPQLGVNEAGDYIAKIDNLKAFVHKFKDNCSFDEIAEMLNRIAENKELLNYVILYSRNEALFEYLSAKDGISYFNLIYTKISEEERQEYYSDIFGKDLEYINYVLYYSIQSIRTQLYQLIPNDTIKMKLLLLSYKQFFPYIKGYPKKKQTRAERFFLFLVESMFNSGEEVMDYIIKDLSWHDYAVRMLNTFLAIAQDLSIPNEKINGVLGSIAKHAGQGILGQLDLSKPVVKL